MPAFSDFSDVLAAFATGTYTVTRKTAVSYGTDGRATASTASTFSLTASVFPIGGRDLQRLPEGLRTAQLRSIICAVELKTEVQGANEADAISIDGDTWQVQSVEPWATDGNFWAAVVLRVGN